MAVLPTGFGLPPIPYLVVLIIAGLAVGGLLWRADPPIDESLVLQLVPWILVGSALHTVHQLDTAPASVTPLLGAPAVYLTTFVVGGAVWLMALRSGNGGRSLGLVGLVLFVLALAGVLGWGRNVTPLWPLAGVVSAAILTAVAWQLLAWLDARVTAVTGWVGLLVVFGHVLDGISTAIGVDVFGFVERTPASRFILDIAATLPTAEVLGTGWLFVVVKLVVAVVVVRLFVDFLREEPRQGYLLLAIIAAVGLGPGAHNLMLYLAS